ncbi:MAG: ABC transporter substrate-binding protein [archaeon]|nr:ABC transporter substrate-binding protein [archaeon]
MSGVGSNATVFQSEGIVIDFGEYRTTWYEADFKTVSDPVELLKKACEKNNYEYAFDGNGKLVSVDGVSDKEVSEWNLWYVEKGKTVPEVSGTYSIDPSKYAVTIWAYCDKDAKPTVAVDASGVSIYGYHQADRVVTLSPVSTETVCSVNGINTIVGTDAYSNYPSAIVKGHEIKDIAIVGTFTDPSYESIMHTSPDMVICDGSQYKHIQMAQTLRGSDVNAVLIYDGVDIKTIIDNIFVVGTAMGYTIAADTTIFDLLTAMGKLLETVKGHSLSKTMMALSTDTSPYIAGSNTYASDIIESMGGKNIYSDMIGWTHINSEYIGPSSGERWDPEVILVLDYGNYGATQSEYDEMMKNLPANWKSTTAYRNGQIYLLCENMGEMSERSGPRFAQFSEIVAKILCPDSFDDGKPVPKFIGNDYLSYLTITKDLGFGD